VPQARFIHIHRDPRHVADSLLHKQRGGPIEDGIRVWEQYVDLHVIPDAPTGGDKVLALAGTTATHLGYTAA
jgi:hypothetical protein